MTSLWREFQWSLWSSFVDFTQYLNDIIVIYVERALKQWSDSVTYSNMWRLVQCQVTQHMQIPLSYADDVIGTAGANISYLRRTSGATITIQESRGVPGEMTVEIHGSASQVQTAQQLIEVWFSLFPFFPMSFTLICLSTQSFFCNIFSCSGWYPTAMSWLGSWAESYCNLIFDDYGGS